MNKLFKYTINDLFEVSNGYGFKSGDFVTESEGSYEVLKMGHIKIGGGLKNDPKKNYFPRKETKKKWLLQRNDIVMAMTDMKDNVVILGVPALIDKDNHYVQNQRVARLRLRKGIEADIPFIFYYLCWEDFLIELQSQANSGVQVNLTTSAIRDSEIFLPRYEEQKAIAGVLTSLDDKIDLLRRQNETLEALAETLFRKWFIEEAQDDWEECSLSDVIDVVGGGTPKTSYDEYWGSEVFWLSGGDIAKNHKNFVIDTDKKITKIGLINCSSKILPTFSTVISARGTVGKFCILGKPMAFSQTNYGILPKHKDCFFFAYLLVNLCVTELISGAYGSVFDTITKKNFHELIISIPHEEVIFLFEEEVKPLFLKKKLNQKQIQILRELREALLPKLMSGEIRVENFLGKV